MSVDTTEEREWDERNLCPDGACIGVIGDDGRCKVCGKQGIAPVAGAPLSEVATEIVEAGAEAGAASELADGSFDEDRELCGDDACIGLIGPDGRCKECGKPRGA